MLLHTASIIHNLAVTGQGELMSHSGIHHVKREVKWLGGRSKKSSNLW